MGIMTEAFIKLKNIYNSCQRCPELLSNRTQVVFGDGNSQSKIILIGEAPGAKEDGQGIPFCGASGKVLDELLKSVQLTREDIFITNTVLCRPPKNRDPKKEELNNCQPRLQELISIMKPKVIVPIGNFATKQILGQTGITKIRGKIFIKTINGIEVKIVPVVHPATFLYAGRNLEKFKKMSEDFKIIAQVIERTNE
jgi:uracil-DNA glycosylase